MSDHVLAAPSKQELLTHINQTPELLGLLYDLGLMPEQAAEGTDNYTRMMLIALHDKNTRRAPPAEEVTFATWATDYLPALTAQDYLRYDLVWRAARKTRKADTSDPAVIADILIVGEAKEDYAFQATSHDHEHALEVAITGAIAHARKGFVTKAFHDDIIRAAEIARELLATEANTYYERTLELQRELASRPAVPKTYTLVKIEPTEALLKSMAVLGTINSAVSIP